MSDDEIFQDMRQQMRPNDELVGRVLDRVAAKTAGPVAAQMGSRRLKAWAYLATAACLVLAVVVALGLRGVGPGQQPVVGPTTGSNQGSAAASPSQAGTDSTDAAVAGPMVSAESYADVYQAVTGSWAALRQSDSGQVMYSDGDFLDEGFLASDSSAESAIEAPAAEAAAADAKLTVTDQTSYTETNVQVAGIDEGDIVKTDGKAIYVASKREVAIYRPDGANTEEIARFDTTDVMSETAPDPTQLNIPGAVLDMFIVDSILVVLVHDYQARGLDVDATDPSTSVQLDATQTKALLYDVTDPAKPKYLTALGQSGSYAASRLQNGILYLVSQYPLVDESTIEETDPATYAPLLMRAPNKSVPIPPGDIAVSTQPEAPMYAVASAISLVTGERLGQQAVLGGAETVYMSANNLYLAANRWDQKFALPTSADKTFDFEGKLTGSVTHLARIALADGALKLEAEGSVPGRLVNQFALDESDGHLRLATTIEGWAAKDFERWIRGAGLFVLDQSLNQVGSVWPLVTDEDIQSVRFTGPVGYVVTFRQTDPLFAIDLSQPSQPKVMSALKIPGFSTYLHPLGTGQLLGLGMNGDDNGSINGMKLSLFDITDPFNVSETQALPIWDYSESSALNDHKAILVDEARGLIGFPAYWYEQDPYRSEVYGDEQDLYHYLVYGYDEAKGFHLIKDLKLDSDRTYDVATRGILIGDFLYICSASHVEVFDLANYNEVAKLTVNNSFASPSDTPLPRDFAVE